jgi:MFS transporter, DHA1 family, solute carrier family 18 (vesicular amine transporter), member 1/2
VPGLAVVIVPVVFLDALLMLAMVPLLPAYASELGLSKAEAGVVVGAYSAAVLFSSLPVGHLADRFGARRLTIAGVVLMAFSTLGFAFAAGFETLLLARIGQGVASAVSWTAGLAWLSSTVTSERRGTALATAMSAGNVGALLGPVVGGVGGHTIGVHATFTLTAAAAFVLALALVPQREARAERRAQPSVLDAARLSLRTRLVLAALVVMTLAALTSGALDTLVPLQLGDAGWSAIAITAVLTVGGVVGVAANQLAGWISDRIDRIAVALGATIVTAAGMALLAGVSGGGPWALSVVYVAVVPGISGLYATAFPLCADGADEAGLGHGIVLGFVNLAWGLGFMVGPAAGGAIADASADAVTYAILAAVSVWAAVWLRSALRR